MASPRNHQQKGVLAEGALVGLIGAGLVAAWFFVYDLAQGAPLRTPSLLGAILFGGAQAAPEGVHAPFVLQYTAVHVLVFLVLGVAIAGLFAIADREPVVLFGAFMLLCCFQVAFVAGLMIVAEWALDPIPWWAILTGNVLATAGMLGVLVPRHPAAWRPWLRRRDPPEAPSGQTHRVPIRSATMNQRGRVLPYLVLWMLGVPASLLIILFVLGVGR
jgi:hypothetical protein